MIFKKIVTGILFIALGTTGCSGQGRKATSQPVKLNTLVKVTEDGSKVVTLSPDFNGFNAQMMRGPKWQTPGFADKVKGLHPKLIRYPGGTVASYWDWKTGWLMDGIEMKPEWKNIPKSPILLEDIKFACDQTGAQPLYVLNMMNSNVNYQIEMLSQAEKIGLKVKYIELDNEIYLGEKFYVNKFPSGKDYAAEANKWISAIKKKFPDVRIAVVGSSVKEGAARKEKKFAERTNNWNREVLAEIQGADAVTFHVYGGSGLNFLANKAAKEDDEDSAGDNIASLQNVFDKSESIQFVLGSPFMRWNNANTYDYKILPKGMKAWITEYNLFEKEGVLAGTWAHGLYALSQTLLFLENSTTELICYHNLTTSAQFAAIFNNDQGFSKAYKKIDNKPFEYSAAGECLALSGTAMQAGGVAVKLAFSNNVLLSANRGQKYPSLNGWVFKSMKGNKIIVTNLSSQPVNASFAEVVKGAITYTQLSASPQKQISQSSDLRKLNGTGERITLPAYSVTLIEGE